MKKKNALFVLIAVLCSSLFFGNSSFAVDLSRCTVGGSTGETPKDYCAGSLYRQYSAIKNACGSSEYSCKVQVKTKLTCGPNLGSQCDTKKEAYASSVAQIIRANDVDPCVTTKISECSNINSSSAASTCQGAITACKKRSSFYAAYHGGSYNPSTGEPVSDNGGGGSGSGGGGGSSSPSSPDSSDDDSSNTETVDPAPVNEGDCTSILPNAWCEGDDGIQQIIRLIILILTGSIVVAGTVGIIICGFLWMTARENEQQVATAKKRMLDIIIGVVAWVLLALLANLFIPKPSDEIQENVNGNVSATKDIEG